MNAIGREKYMDVAEVRQLRTVTEAWAITDKQAGRLRGPLVWAVVDTTLSTGLRVSELAALTVGDANLKRGCLRVVRRKRKKRASETLAIGNGFRGHLKDFIDWKASVGQGTAKGDALFIGKRGTPLTPQGLMQLWKVAVKRAGLPRELTIHCGRHTMAVHLLKKTRNLRQVQKQLGHASPAITANLYADVSFEDMQAGVNGLYDDTGENGRTR